MIDDVKTTADDWNTWRMMVLTKLKEHDQAVITLKSELANDLTSLYERIDQKSETRAQILHKRLDNFENKIDQLERDIRETINQENKDLRRTVDENKTAIATIKAQTATIAALISTSAAAIISYLIS